MTEEQVVESAQESSEVVEQPKATVPSVPSGDQLTSAPSSGVDIEEMIDRKIQSVKDRRLDRVPKLEEKLEQLIELYESTPKESSPEVVGTTGGGEQAYMEAMSTQILDGAGIEFDDPEYNALVERYGGQVTPEQWVNVTKAFAEKRGTKVAKQESVTEAAGATAAGAAVSVSAEDELAGLSSRLEEIRSGGQAAIDPIIKAEREKIMTRLNELEPQEKLGIL